MNTKSLIQMLAVAVVLAAPAASFAQSAQPETRAQVRAELRQLEAAGLRPSGNDTLYPADIQAAEAKVAANNGTAQASVEHTSFGSSMAGSSQSGAVAAPALASQQIYFGR